MTDLGIADTSVFATWLQEERTYLEGLKKEPAEETMQMDYYQKLVNLWASECVPAVCYVATTAEHPGRASLAAATTVWSSSAPGVKDNTRVIETRQRHAIENLNKDLNAVQVLEVRMEITERWTPTSPACHEAAQLLHMRKYQRALDAVEGLVVARVFELSKMNRSQTGKFSHLSNLAPADYQVGYHLRKHIGQALQRRSSAIRAALDRYNAAALALKPPRSPLKWEDVVEYAFLSDFDLLRDARQNIQHRPWATPAGHLAMDTHFKILRAREEIVRLNVEIRHVATHIQDEDFYLCARQEAVCATDPALAHQIFVHRMLRGRFKEHHRLCLQAIAKTPGFTGTITPGKALNPSSSASPPATHSIPTTAGLPNSPSEGAPAATSEAYEEMAALALEKEVEDEEADEEVSRDLLDILRISLDGMQLVG